MVIDNYAAANALKEENCENDVSDLLQAKQLEQRIHLAIQDLPSHCREAFILSRFEQLSYKEIAERMNISVNTVEKHIGKALSKLRKEIRELDFIMILVITYSLLFRLSFLILLFHFVYVFIYLMNELTITSSGT